MSEADERIKLAREIWPTRSEKYGTPLAVVAAMEDLFSAADERDELRDIVYRVRDILRCGHIENVAKAVATLNTRYNEKAALVATRERERDSLQEREAWAVKRMAWYGERVAELEERLSNVRGDDY